MSDEQDKKDMALMKKFLKKHTGMSIGFLIFLAAIIGAAVYVLLWVAADAQATGMVPSGIGMWTVGIFVDFILHLIFWELVLVASWAAPIAILIYYQWYMKLPAKERKEYERNKSRGRDSGLSFIAGLLWLGVVWYNGLWNLPFQEWTVNQWVYTCLTSWGIVFAGIALFGTVFIAYVLSTKK